MNIDMDNLISYQRQVFKLFYFNIRKSPFGGMIKGQINIDFAKQLINFSKHREMGWIAPKYYVPYLQMPKVIRRMKVDDINDFAFWFTRLHFPKQDAVYNYYYSLADYGDKYPRIDTKNSFIGGKWVWNVNNPESESYKEFENFENNVYDYVEGYDMLFDLDFHGKAVNGIVTPFKFAKAFSRLLDEVKVPYISRYTGRGFHIIIPSTGILPDGYSLNGNDEKNVYKLYIALKEKMKKWFFSIDPFGADVRRMCKVPYTPVFTDEGTFISHEFISKNEFYAFKLDNYRAKNYTFDYERMPFTFNVSHIDDKKCLVRLAKKIGVKL